MGVLCERATRKTSLGRREKEVLAELVDGRTEVDIAGRLGISRHTVHAHVRSVYMKLNVHSRVELIHRVIALAD